jgi:hypothetical protein
MTSGTNGTSIAEAIDVVEETYEYMLAYAAQGRGRDDDDESIRDYLKRAEAALGVIAAATPHASIHLRALLTDLFLLDEALKISGI